MNLTNYIPGFSIKKLGFSLGAGFLCFFFASYSTNITLGNININFVWSIIFPITVAIFYGPYYGIISGIAGGAIYPFVIWEGNGYTNIINFLILDGIYFTLGFLYNKIDPENQFIYSLRLARLLFILFVAQGIAYLVIFPIALKYNPPFWTNIVVNEIDSKILFSFLVKDSILLVTVACTGDILFHMRSVRNFFGLPVYERMNGNSKIFVFALIVSCIIAFSYIILHYILIGDLPIDDPHYGIAVIVIFMGGIISSGIIIKYVEQLSQAEEIAKLNAMLQEEIAKEKDVELALQNALEKEKELSELKSRFIITISHEFRTPLSTILSSSELIANYREKIGDDKIDKLSEKINLSVIQITKLLDDVISLNKTSTSEITMDIKQLLDKIDSTNRNQP